MSNENEKNERITFDREVSLVLIGYPSSSPITITDLHTRLPDLELPEGLQIVLRDILNRGETVYNNLNILNRGETVYNNLILLPLENLSEFVSEKGNTTHNIQYTLAFGAHSSYIETAQVLEDIESKGYTNFLCWMDMR